MQNWSKYIKWQPKAIYFPETEVAIQQLIQDAIAQNRKVRIIGSGHSFNPLWVNQDTLISLDNYQGLIVVDQQNLQVRVKAGTKLKLLGKLLFEHGLAMENMGDIDAQSIAGTIGTGTHGTGLDFGSISTQVRSIKFVNGLGELVTCSTTENVDLFRAAQVSLGALGIITEITLQCVSAYRLELVNRKEAIQQVMDQFLERIKQNRNFEFYWFPHTETAWTKTSNVITEQADKVGLANYLTEYFLENYVFQVLCNAATKIPSQNARVAKISAASIPNLRKVFHSHKIYATPRLVRFNEMEYSVPLEAHHTVLSEIRKVFKQAKFPVHFPIENRVVKGDDILISPAYRRDSAYIAVHVYHKKDFRPYFKKMEAIFLAHGGRPHWGKMHTLGNRELAERYPKWTTFQTIRKQQDPQGTFLNDYLKQIFLA
ncbi:MAG: D-arabinono-1,4-lactone oxidase [Saprospiraceae bacterium]